MNTLATEQPDYGNWVSKRIVFAPVVVGLALLGLAVWWSPFWVIPAALCLLASLYFIYARYRFGPQGGDVQGQIRQLLLQRLAWTGTGRALDIGCGNGALAIELARLHPQAQVVGIDCWGKQWEYSKQVCEKNAQGAGVASRVSFGQASASSLPFEDGFFDVVVSNLVFNEVRDVKDKREVLREALRVVKPGGTFAFQDLFLFKRLYGSTDELIDTIQRWGIRKVEFIKTCDAPFIPKPLKLPFMVGTIGLIVGEK